MAVNSEFKSKWERLEGGFASSVENLKELRELVAKGIVSQEIYDEFHGYVVTGGLSDKDLRKLERQGSSILDRALEMAKIKRPLPRQVSAAHRPPVMEGFLWKRAIRSGRNWKRRYVRLYHDRIEYFGKKKDITPRGRIQISKDCYVADSIFRRIKNVREHGFMVSDFQSSYYLAATSADSKLHWMQTIRRVISQLQEHDKEKDLPMLLDRPARSKSVVARDSKKRMSNYRKSLSKLEGAEKGSARSSTRRQQRKGLRKSKSKHRHSKKKQKPKDVQTAKDEGEDEDEGPRITDADAEAEAILRRQREREAEEEAAQELARAPMLALATAQQQEADEEAEHLRVAAEEAEAASVAADLANVVAQGHEDEILAEEEALKEQLQEALEDGDTDRVEELRATWRGTKERLVEIEATIARTAAERAEADEIAERNRRRAARIEEEQAFAAQLDAVDQAIRKAEELAAVAEEARLKAEAAAVHRGPIGTPQDSSDEDQDPDSDVEERLRAQATVPQYDNGRHVRFAQGDPATSGDAARGAPGKQKEHDVKFDPEARSSQVLQALRLTSATGDERRAVDRIADQKRLSPRRMARQRKPTAPERRRSSASSKASSVSSSRSETSRGPGESGGWFGSLVQKARAGIDQMLRPNQQQQAMGGDDEVPVHDDRNESDDHLNALLHDDEHDDEEYAEEEEEGGDEDPENVDVEAAKLKRRDSATALWIASEIERLIECIHDLGDKDAKGRSVATFEQINVIYEDINASLMGILLRAKRAGKVHYKGEILFRDTDGDVVITVLEEKH
ncbi:Actin-binding Rho-activating protein (MS1) (Striated muscle activator of Rho-dependent signaling) (STARS) [Durusdinium trenchii]|uniref:Actin-binding Rho-activating protein (MS1) (Striated muscle activator of Rho-dependent signaling) (STARS) n=1 Tax=Durusdinium trenchii TaxID=1381693 RepID=A0ABP0SBW2_9DINO